MAFRGMQVESEAQGRAHESVAKDLHTLVADPFQRWAHGHKVRLDRSHSGYCLLTRIVTAGEIETNQDHGS